MARRVFRGNVICHFLTQWKGEVGEETIWNEEFRIMSRFCKLRLEDKSVFQGGGNIKNPNEIVVPPIPCLCARERKSKLVGEGEYRYM